MPTRSCVICKRKNEKENLLRFVNLDSNDVILDKNQKINKRAIYICKSKSCIEKALNLIDKNKLKFKSQIGINTGSLKVLLNEIKSELGE